MPGFVQDPLQIINLIADNLRDRYRDETAVLKEIVQNADDAEADRLDFVLVNAGVPLAKNRLLRGPALVAVNNGRFRKRDARGLRQFGLSVKSADQGAIGKFGLGQKSVFHLCEAFLHCAEGAVEPEDPNFPYRGVVNPWSDVPSHHALFPDWDDFSDGDWSLMSQALAPLGVFSQRFVLWLPLRSEAQLRHENGHIDPIVRHYVDPALLATRLCSAAILAECLPVLEYLRIISVHSTADENGWRTLATCELETTTERLRRGKGADGHQSVELAGRVAIHQNPENKKLDFVGRQEIGATARLERLGQNQVWPITYLRDEDGLASIVRKEKAPAQGAVILARRPSTPDSGKLTIDWAVFLPVGELQREVISLRKLNNSTRATSDFHLILHGYFFLDAGRQSIEAIMEASANEPIKDESDLRRAWNTTLRDELVLPTIPTVLSAGQKGLHLTTSELAILCDALRQSSVWTRHSETIISKARLVLELKASGSVWRIVAPDVELRPLHGPTAEERDRPWQVLPGLTELQNRRRDFVFVASGAPHLTSQDFLKAWKPAEVADLIEKTPIVIFKRRAHVTYFAAFLDLTADVGRSPEVGSALFKLLRQVLSVETGLDLLTGSTQSVLPLLARISAERLLFLSEKAAVPEVLSALAAAATALLVLPSTLEPDAYKPARLDGETIIGLLVALQSHAEHTSESVADAVSRAAAEILKLASSHNAAFVQHSRVHRLQIFRVRTWRTERFVSKSYIDLISSHDQRRLFLATPGDTLPRLLQLVLVDQEVLTLDRELADLLGIDGAACSPESCLDAVFRSRSLAKADTRARLLKRVRGVDGNNFRQELRYLSHGYSEAKQSDASLLVTEGAELDALLRPLLNRRAEGWRLLSESISDELTGELRRILDVESLDDAKIATLLRNASEDELAPARHLSGEAQRRLLIAIDDRTTWRRLPIHRFVDSGIGALDANSFLEASNPVPASLQNIVRLVRRAMDATVAARQSEFVEGWHPVAMVSTCLDQPQPDCFSREILDALDAIRDDVPHELCERLRRIRWLDLSSGPAKPEDILDLPEDVARAAARLLADQNEHSFITVASVPGEIRNRPAWQRIEHLTLSGTEALEGLALVLEGKTELSLAPDVVGTAFPLDAAKTLSECGLALRLLSWPLLVAAFRRFSEADIEARLLPKLRGALPAETLRIVLRQIAEYDKAASQDQRSPTRKLFAFYLRASLTHEERASILEAIELPNRHGGWTAAARIALDAHGVVPSALLHPDFSQLFEQNGIVVRVDDRPDEIEGQRVGRSADVLRAYFEPWRHRVPLTPVGAFLALLGSDPTIERLAAQYLQEGQRDLPTTLELIANSRDRATAAGRFKELRGRHRFAVTLAAGNAVALTSITGHRFEAWPSENFDNLLVGDSLNQRIHGNNVALVLRAVDPSATSQSDLLDALWSATDAVLADVYVVMEGGRELLKNSLFEPWIDSGKIAIDTARDRAIDELPGQLKDLPLDPDSALAESLRGLEDAWRRHAQARSAGSGDNVNAAKNNLARVVQEDYAAQQTLLEAVRRRIDEQEYRPDRVPFELFQNADDAVVEGSDDPARDGRVVIEVNADRLRLVHWGRPINDLGPDPDVGRQRNYDMDLQKLLKLGFSGKTFDMRTTGRFGLGFKSVYLVTDVPQIVSRWITTHIQGSVIPVSAPDAGGLAAQYQGSTAATVIDLPRREGGPSPVEYVSEIRRSVGPLCVFSKAVRGISWKANGKKLDVVWEPQPIASIEGIEIGRLRFGIEDEEQDVVMVFRCGAEALLIRLCTNGVYPLPPDMPTVWSLAPTEERWKTGYLINGQFRVDVGRSRLAGDDTENVQHIARLGARLAEQLVAFFDASQNDWPGVAARLGLAETSRVTLPAFWRSLFDILSRGLTPGAPGADFLGQLHNKRCGLATLIMQRAALPTTLDDASLQLIQFSNTLSYAAGALAAEPLRRSVASWPYARIALASCVTKDVADRCSYLGLPPLRKLTLRELLRRELGVEAKIDTALGAQLGRSLNLESIENIVTETAERREVDTELRRCRFEAEDGSWQSVADLHARGTGNAEEERRLAFAPPRAVLKREYSNDSLLFFLLARARSGFSPQARVLAEWACDAATLETQRAVLRYLLQGGSARALAELLRDGRPSWLTSAAALSNPGLIAGLSRDDLTRLRADLFPETLSVIAPPRFGDVSPDAGPFLAVVHDWWVQYGERVSSEYTARTYPNGFDASALRDSHSEEGRISWFTLLALASFQTIGRTREEQHRSFLEAGLRDGWWQELATSTSDDPSPWLRRMESVAEEYVDGQPFLQWYRRIFDLYILARWSGVYSHLFLSLPQRIQQMDGALSLRRLMQPLADPALSGSGIWAPAIDRTLGYGVCFVIRELARFNVIDGRVLEPYTWQATLRLRELLQWLGMDAPNESTPDNAPRIWRLVSAQIGADRARFRGDFDLPLQLLTTSRLRQERTTLAQMAHVDAGMLDEKLGALDAQSPDDRLE